MSASAPMAPPRLRILVIAADPGDATFARSVLEDHGDSVSLATDVMDALSQLTKAAFDLALVSLSLPRGDGLALVHHIRALYPKVDVLVMAAPTEINESAHAMAMGVLQTVMQPLTGDALLVAADRARERRLLVSERARLSAEREVSRRRTATYARCAAFVAEADAMVIAPLVLEACAGELELHGAVIYVPEALGSLDFVRAAERGICDELPLALSEEFVLGLDPTIPIAAEDDRLTLVLLGDADVHAVIRLLPQDPEAISDQVRQGLEIVASLGTAAFSAAQKVEAIARTGIKDPETSAYTFAYFGDVAGREIDRAARHGRRFALLTLGFDGIEALRASCAREELLDIRRTLTDAVLESIRDSDVLARVEDEELYALLPETGMLGALATRRRVRQRLLELPAMRVGESSLEPVVGLAVYPFDGADLGKLLRVSRRRSESSREGLWRRLGLTGRPFFEIAELLLADVEERISGGTSRDDEGLSGPAMLPRKMVERMASTLVRDAANHRVRGTIYAAGDRELDAAFARALSASGPTALRRWLLSAAPAPGLPRSPSGTTGADRIRLQVEDPRLADRVLLLSLTELGGYALIARPLDEHTLIGYHSSDVFIVEGLATALQGAYHLQPEVE